MLKLISATPSPYARKVRIALAEKGIAFEPERMEQRPSMASSRPYAQTITDEVV